MKKKKWIAGAVVLAVLCIFAAVDILRSRGSDILAGIPFSGTYTDRNGILLHVYLTSDETYRIYKPVTEYPPDFLEALLLQEDRRFFSHHGINPGALVRAGWETYVRHSRRIGASTITMQVAKLKYHLYTKNIPGKLKQIFLAMRLELLYSKQQILDAYVNLAPCGKNIEGFESASRYFFGTGIEKTNLSQKLMLCVLPQNPTERCPRPGVVPPELLKARSRLFASWLQYHPENKDDSVVMDMLPSLVCSFPDLAPHFTRMLELASGAAERKGMVRTSLDADLQKLCTNLLETYVLQRGTLGVQNGAVLLADTTTMQIAADVGSAGFYKDSIEGQVDANISRRSPGSTLKPFIYGLALQQGRIHYDTMLKDTPSSFSAYTPDNYGNTFKGPIHAWRALTESRNIPAITLAHRLKNPDLYGFLKKAGVAELNDRDTYGLSIVLGSADVTPFELVTMYAALVNGGTEKTLRTLYRQSGQSRKEQQLLTPEAAFIVRQMLEKNPPPLENRPAAARRVPVAFKTGTSVGFRDAWTIGFFDRYVLCVWIGNFDGAGNNAFLGRAMAAPLFFAAADSILSRIPDTELMPYPPVPDGVKLVRVCSVSGNLPGPDCPKTELSWFIPGVSPITSCRIHRKINIDTRTGYRTDETGRPYIRTVVREFWPSDLQELFLQAGLPRLVPPGYPPDDFRLNPEKQGYPPEIISPLQYTRYLFRRSEPGRSTVILTASADADTRELIWFADNSFICRTKPGEKYEWHPEPGSYEITVTDIKGRSDSRSVTVSLTD